MTPTSALILCALLLGLAGPARPAAAQSAARATTAPTLSTEAQLTFLASAKIVASRPIGKGVTGALRLTLSDGTTTHDAAFQRVADDQKFDGKRRAGELRFVDHYRYNIAAWRLASLLGLGHMMPATVERRVEGAPGALSWWVDGVMMDEGERGDKDVQPPDAKEFSHQRQRMSVFAELVRDMDRNKGNVVYTTDWRVIMLDFTRAFRIETDLRTPGLLAICDRRLLAAMRALTLSSLEQATGDTLTANERKAVMTRRDRLVAHFERLIAERGESVVLY